MEPTTDIYPEPVPTCEARVGPLKDFADNMPLWCCQTRGLRSIPDGNGHPHHFCAARGHEANVRRWVGRNYPVERAPGELVMEYGR